VTVLLFNYKFQKPRLFVELSATGLAVSIVELLTMTQTVSSSPKFLTMEEYLAYDDGTDKRYELVDGELVEMPVESQLNASIAKFLFFELAKHLPIALLALKDTEIEVSGRRAKCRLLDLIVHSEESSVALVGARRATLTRDMPSPVLVVEVVSPGTENRDLLCRYRKGRNYRHKRTEYAAREIAEYWIIDPEVQQITLCLWVNGQYEDTVYTGDTPIKSTVIPDFGLNPFPKLGRGTLKSCPPSPNFGRRVWGMRANAATCKGDMLPGKDLRLLEEVAPGTPIVAQISSRDAPNQPKKFFCCTFEGFSIALT
jgi:Uma2 family endonuclease